MTTLLRVIYLPFSVAITVVIMMQGWGMRPASWTIIVLGYSLQALILMLLAAVEVWEKNQEKK